jgi:hypothetical protein
MLSYLLQLALFGGLGALLPAPGPQPAQWWGTRLFGGIVLADVVLFVFGWLAGISLPIVGWIVAAAAAAGWVRVVLVARSNLDRRVLGHPIVVLPLLLLAVLAIRGEAVTYIPFGWDEFSNWQRWTFEMVGRGLVWEPAMDLPITGYTPGLPLLMALPSLLLGRFDEAHSATLQFIMHVGLLAMVWELARGWLTPRAPSPAWASGSAWLVILLLLLAEVTWKLFPTLQLIEKPQIYSYAAFMTLMVTAARADISPGRLGMLGGLILVHALLIKLATQLFLPSALLLALVPTAGLDRTGRARLLAGIGIPVIVGLGAWKLAGIPDPSDWQSLGPLLKTIDEWGIAGLVQRMDKVARDFVPALIGFLADFKPWLSAIAFAGFAMAWRRREARLVLAALLLFLVATEVILYVFHLKWVGYHEINSIDRFTRVPLRPLHLFGVLFGLLIVAEWVLGKLPGRALRLAPVLAVMVAMLLLVQLMMVNRGLTEIVTRPNAGLVFAMRAEGRQLAALVRERGMADVHVQVIEQGGENFAQQLAFYYALRDRQGLVIHPQSSWGASKDNTWRVVMGRGELIAKLAERDVLWPVKVDAWIAPAVADLVDDLPCRAEPVRFFLIRNHGGGFDCVPKAQN